MNSNLQRQFERRAWLSENDIATGSQLSIYAARIVIEQLLKRGELVRDGPGFRRGTGKKEANTMTEQPVARIRWSTNNLVDQRRAKEAGLLAAAMYGGETEKEVLERAGRFAQWILGP